MARFKLRWMLIQVEFPRNATANRVIDWEKGPPSSSSLLFTDKDLLFAIQDTIVSCFGIVMAGIVLDIQVRFFDCITNLALIRVPKSHATKIHASITSITTLKNQPTIISVLAMNSTSRTAKLTAIRHTKNLYRKYYYYHQNEKNSKQKNNTSKQQRKICEAIIKRLQKQLSIIQVIPF